jgi:5,10-methylene-tetrahydrofolate dehydrogenase/Methenyl tetrahydrofolate cyclohydrolase
VQMLVLAPNLICLKKDVEEDVLLNHIKSLNEQEDVDGILVQLPCRHIYQCKK